MGRWFNTAEPCMPDRHYMVPASARLPQVPRLVSRGNYVVVHAPRQTGKTTTLAALAAELTASGDYAALLTSCEPGRAWGDDVGAATRAILDRTLADAHAALPPRLHPPRWPEASDGGLLGAALAAWSQVCPRPLVLFLDEIDALAGRTLISVLGQLRSGAGRRPAAFPASVALCGLRDLRDYRSGDRPADPRSGPGTASGGNPDRDRLGGPSPFNIVVRSLRLGDFSLDEVRGLYAQHTAETAQVFTAEAVDRVMELTAGQPWLVNALAAEIVDEMAVPPTEAITTVHVDAAKERLIRARATHLDSLADKLHEPRVRAIIEPVLAGTDPVTDPPADDVQYARDLGLLAQTSPAQIANPIYREVVARVLTDTVLEFSAPVPPARSFVLPDGRLDVPSLIDRFAAFWKANGDILTSRQVYHEAAPHLVLMAFLERVINGGGFVDREYGVGRGRIDLLVRWPYSGPDGRPALQREAFELKARAGGAADPLRTGLDQLDGYLDRLGLDHGTLVIFDRRPTAKPIAERTSITTVSSPTGRGITLLRA
ncbi:AAA domain-containing protein [Frankia sp. AiPs1]|uniref:ATP-binding protein n=1 Tax=Frankia sp. AiPa1 TaxID=573492 RepID=UPI00202B3C5E|nr:ATP-binding protein [Frankia sp. AiPa1]MCL9759459.1 ATP-binding protein [Frankia sp. AiPa1]